MPDAEPESDEPVEGRLIADRYRMHSKIGGGAMGSVWSGTDELLRRPVAIKVVQLPKGIPTEEAAEIRERTLREARAIAVVSHPNVVTLYDVAREGEDPFVVMELVPSQSLATIIREHGPLGDRQLATLTNAVAAALDTAHRSGVVHRDVKPGNVLLSSDGQIKLSDFGISRNVAEPTLTRTGIMLGTPAFIAPEVAAGEPITSAADLWGLGATLFAAAAGRPPYDSDDNPVETITSVVNDPVPEPDKQGPLGEVIAGLMVKDPQLRLSLREVRRLVQPLLPEPGAEPFAHLLPAEASTERTPLSGTPAPSYTSEEERHPGTGSHESAEPSPSGRTGRDTSKASADAAEQPAPLAADPGPLPFTPSSPPPRKRSRIGVVALALAAVAVFVLSSAGTFLGTRFLADQPLLPVQDGTRGTVLPEPVQLREYHGRIAHRGDGGASDYSISAPTGWSRFQGYSQGPPTRSMTVHFLSPNGRTELAVQRFGDYYERGYTTRGYLIALRNKHRAPGRLEMLSQRTDGPPRSGGHRDRTLTYRTTSPGIGGTGSGTTRRFTTARVMARDGDLWVVRVTAPDRSEARDLHERTASRFRAG
ncbi:serine/threonine protein kinase [Actinopolyspora biskrensis]|uniref:non-specific serine/threonine protein kinase n=1 Tax=Actinopolyspora biskrensis TaxID=1470178 RepID=A0A852YZ94_9ACTN|nr:serine/threonine protein kinase [Actinopolyspora biskrensis]